MIGDALPVPPGLDRLLDHLGIGRGALLGEGGESMVYALDGARVVRVPRDGSIEQLRLRADFLNEMDSSKLSYATPHVIEVGEHAGTPYCIEARLRGRSLSDVLGLVGGEARRRALDQYVRAAGELRRVPFERPWFGELLGPFVVRRDRWPAFLVARVHEVLKMSAPDLSDDLGPRALDALVGRFEHDVALVADVTIPALVHGDWFPGNVLADNDGTFTAAIDFSVLSLAGDWRMDAAAAVIFMEVVRTATDADYDAVAELARHHYGEDVMRLIPLYRTYYGLFFSFTKRQSPRLYQWCLNSLRR